MSGTPPAAFDFVARLRWRIYAAVVRRPATLATRQGPLLLLACCHYRDGVSGPISAFHRSCELREFQHNVAPTCQGLPSKSTRVARPWLSLDRLAGPHPRIRDLGILFYEHSRKHGRTSARAVSKMFRALPAATPAAQDRRPQGFGRRARRCRV